jgi:excisionase family DNA binding protein
MERIALTIIEACQVAGVSRTSLYAAIGRGELAARKWGRRTLVLTDDLRNWVNQLPTLASPALREAQLKPGQAISDAGGSNDPAS